MSQQNESDKGEKRKEKIVDALHEAASFIASTNPLVAVLHSIFVESPLEKRLKRILEDVLKDLDELKRQRDGITEEYLSKNEVFITAVSTVLLIGMREHRKEKLEALRNIVLNSALPNDIDDDIQLMFVQLVDQFTTWHLVVLRFFNNNDWWQELGYNTLPEKENVEEFVDRLRNVMPDLKNINVAYKIVNDLSRNELLVFSQAGSGVVFLVLEESRKNILPASGGATTELGKKFVKFISSPLNDRASNT